MTKYNGKRCVICDTKLEGARRLFCSNACKQADKYERKKGERCGSCRAVIKKPRPVLGGFNQQCKACERKSK